MREKLDELLIVLTSWGCDRWIHLVASLVIAWLIAVIITIGAIIAYQPIEHHVIGLISIVIAAALGASKEWYDLKTFGSFDMQDLAADFVGVALFFAVYSL